jgi:hypothetical protein
MDDNRFAKVSKTKKINTLKATWTVSKTLVRKLDINITGEQARWIKYGIHDPIRRRRRRRRRGRGRGKITERRTRL